MIKTIEIVAKISFEIEDSFIENTELSDVERSFEEAKRDTIRKLEMLSLDSGLFSVDLHDLKSSSLK